jgi:two-component system, chemotaxis family, chemotaxis protein CheY
MANIIIVEDSSFMRLILRDMLRKAGHHIVAEAENGAIGVSKYQEHRPDLVIMNLVMPELSGIDALKQIKGLHPKAKVIICSAMGNQFSVIEAIKGGALDFIVKPFDEARLLRAVDRVLQL